MARILLVLFCALLAGCGFHFRDSVSFASDPTLKYVYIQDNAHGRTGLIFVLRQNLEAMGITPVAQPSQAPITLSILNDRFDQAITVLGNAQQLNSQTLIYKVTVQLQNSHGTPLTDPTTLTTQVTFWQNANQILGDTTAIPPLKQNLVHNMTQKILAYLRANNTQKALQHAPTA